MGGRDEACGEALRSDQGRAPLRHRGGHRDVRPGGSGGAMTRYRMYAVAQWERDRGKALVRSRRNQLGQRKRYKHGRTYRTR